MRKWISVVLMCVVLCAAGGCGGDLPQNYVFAPADVAGKTVGVLSDSAAQGFAQRDEEIGAVVTRESAEELMAALKSGAVDCALVESSQAKAVMKGVSKVKALDEKYVDCGFSIVIARENIALTKDVNTALETLRADGTLDKIAARYINGGDYIYETTLDPETAAGTLSLIVSADFPPYSYYGEDGEITGLDIDVARAVCDLLNVDLEIVDARADKLMNNVIWGNADLAMGQFVWNEADGAKVDFSDVYYTSQQTIIVRK